MSRQDLYPWLLALYVNEDYKGMNIGEELQNYLIKYCKKEGFSELFLFTDISNYYERKGWKYLEYGIEYSGDSIKIYKKEI